MMSIRVRVLFAAVLLSSVLLFGLWKLEYQQKLNITQITSEQQEHLQTLFSHAVDQEQKTLQTLVFDYTFWDELVNFVQTPDQTWANNVLEPSTQVFDVDCLWVYSSDNELVYQNKEDLCGLYSPHFMRKPEDLFQQAKFVKYTDWKSNVPAISIYGATIHPSEDVAHETSPRGYFLVGRFWTQVRLEHLNKLSNLEVSIITPSSLDEILLSSETTIYTIYPLLGVDNSTQAYLIGKFENAYLAEFIKSQKQYRIYSLVLTASLLGLLLVTISFWVIHPLEKLASALRNQNIKALEPLLREKSEFGQVAYHLHQFLLHKGEVEQALQQHKQILQNLRLSEERYRLITASTSDFTFSLRVTEDFQYFIEWGLDSLQSIIPDIKSDLFFQKVFQYLDPPQEFSYVDQMKKDLHNGHQASIVIHIPQRNRDALWYRFNLIPEMDQKSGHLIQILGSAHNITEERNAFEEFLKVLENSNSAEFIVDRERILYLNPKAKELAGEKGFITDFSSVLNNIHPEDQSKILFLFTKQNEISSTEFPVLIRYSPSDKVWRWLNLTIEPVLFQNHSALRISLLDITEKRNIELALSAQTQYSNFLSEVFNAWILIFSETGELLVSSKKGEEILSPELFSKNTSIWNLFEFPKNPLSPEILTEFIKSRKTFREIPVILLNTNPRRWFLWSHTYLEPQDGEPLRILAVLTEITEQKIKEFYAKAIREIASRIQSEDTQEGVLKFIPQALCEEIELEGAGWILQHHNQSLELQYPFGTLKAQIPLQINSAFSSSLKKIQENSEPEICSALELFSSIDYSSYQAILFPTSITFNDSNYTLVILVTPPVSSSLIEACDSLCKMAGSIIERITSLTQANQRLQYMTSLHLISTSISASLDLNLTLRSLVNQIMGQLQVDAVAVFLVNPTTHILEYAAGEGFRAVDIARTRLRIGEDQAGKAALTRKTIFLYDKDGIAPFFQRAHLFINEDFVAYYAVPLIVQGEVKGVLETFHRNPFIPSQEWVQFLEALATETANAIKNAELIQKIQHNNLELSLSFDATLMTWAQSVEWHANLPEGSTLRLVDTAMQFAQFVGIDNAHLQHFRQGVILHDIGKLMVPRHILQKPGPLSDSEWEIVRQAPVFAFNLLSKVPLMQSTVLIPYMQHERWDGHGYPQGLHRQDIPYPVRVFSIVKIWDALRSPRPFRKAWDDKQILEYLEANAGKIFDPEIVPAFLRFLKHRLQNKG